jgi:hypothetical protein
MVDVKAELEELGRRVRLVKTPDLYGLLWRSETEEEANRALQRCPSFASGGNKSSSRTNSDADGDTKNGWRTPFDPEPDEHGP